MDISPTSRIQSLWSTLKVNASLILHSIFVVAGSVFQSAASLVIDVKTNLVEWYMEKLNQNTAERLIVKRAIMAFDKLKRLRLSRIVMDSLSTVRRCILSVLVLSYCIIVSVFLDRKYQLLEFPQKFFNISYARTIILAFVSVSIISLVIIANWESQYPERDVLAMQDIQIANDYMPEFENELLSRAGASIGNNPALTVDNAFSQPITTIEDQTESQEKGLQDNENYEIESLRVLFKNIAGLDKNALDQITETEVDLLNFLDQSPHTIGSILDNYEKFPDGKAKDLLRSLLATTGSQEVEQRAIERVTSGDLEDKTEWLALLRDTGIHSSKGRNSLLEQLPNFTEAEELSSAILAFAPDIVAASTKQEIIDRLSPYINHSDDMVRNAAVVSLSRWADSDHSYILEQALKDSTVSVRQAAVSAAFTSTIKSDYIKTILLDIMQDDNEYWPLRMDAHNALTGYTLQGHEYDEYFQFHKEQTKNINIDEVKG